MMKTKKIVNPLRDEGVCSWVTSFSPLEKQNGVDLDRASSPSFLSGTAGFLQV
jgi:hypothetical protein